MDVQRSLLTANATRMVYAVGSAVILQLYLDSLGATAFQVSLIEMLFWLGLLISAPFWGALSDAFGRRRGFLILSSLLASIAVLAYSFTTWFTGIYALRFFFAVTAAAFPPIALALFTVGRGDKDRGRDIGKYNLSRAVGFVIGWGGSGILVDHIGYAAGFQVLAAVGGVSLVAVLLVTEDHPPRTESFREALHDGFHRMVPDLREPLMRENGIHMLYLSITVRKMAFIGIISVIAVLLRQRIGITASLVGILLAINPLTQLLMLSWFQRLADVAGRRAVLLIGLVLSLGFPLGLLVAETVPVAVLAFVMQGASFAAFVQGSTAHIGDTAPDDRQGELLGYRKSMQGLAGVFGPLLAGSIATVAGYDAMLIVMTGVIGVSFLIGYIGVKESLQSVELRPLSGSLLRQTLFRSG